MSYHSEDLCPENTTDWEALNRDNVGGSIYHGLRWKEVLERSFGIKSHYFMVYGEEGPVALCPFFEHPLKGVRSLTPPPATDLRNILVSDPSDLSIVEEVAIKSTSIAKNNRCAFVLMEYSNNDAIAAVQQAAPVRWSKPAPFSVNGYFNLDLEEHNPTYIWEKVFNSKDSQKKYIRSSSPGYASTIWSKWDRSNGASPIWLMLRE